MNIEALSKQVQELSYENIKFRLHIERQEEENERLISIIETVEKALTYYAEEPYLVSIGYSTNAIEALQVIRGK